MKSAYDKPPSDYAPGHGAGRKGRHGGPKVDRQDKRKRKVAEKSRRRNRR